MTIDIDRLSPRELETLITKAKKRKTALGKRKPAAVVRRKVATLAKSEGYSIEELFGGSKPAPRARKAATGARKTTGSKVAPKYRNPSNPKETWAGRGKQPRWLAAQTGKGRKLEDFLIK